jgi:ribosomal protein L11 methyltransferase
MSQITEYPLPTAVVSFEASASEAQRLSNLLEETLPLDENTVSSFENSEDESRWKVEVYAGPNIAPEVLLKTVSEALGDEADRLDLKATRIEDADWVAASLEGLAPVRAGRFFVHGGHDSHRVPVNAHGIRVEAALAFGTGHHGTTLGCLLALEDVLKRRRPAKVLDLGTGTGVLAIAAAKALKRRVLATDIDPVSVRITGENAKLNRVGHLVTSAEAAGFASPAIARGAPYDLILANILAAPLVALSTDMVRHLAPGGTVILSGLLVRQERMVLAAYAARGLRLTARRHIENWATLTLTRG